MDGFLATMYTPEFPIIDETLKSVQSEPGDEAKCIQLVRSV